MRTLKAAVLAVALLLGGCAANPATGGRSFNLLSKGYERSIGNQTAQQAIELYGLYNPDARMTGYVLDLCRKTWAVTEEAHEPIQCLLLDSEEFNAWATPGYINTYRGLLPYLQSESQLVGVLGHEAGHVVARHVGQQQTASILTGIAATAAGIYVASRSDDPGFVNAATTVIGVGAGLGLAKYSRAHESEADEIGIRYLERMGYDKREAVAMLNALVARQDYMFEELMAFNNGQPVREDALQGLFASHPTGLSRQQAAAAMVGGWPDGTVNLPEGITPAAPANDPDGRARFHKMITGLPYGPKAEFGIAGRDHLSFPKQHFGWTLPDGFLLRFRGATAKAKNGPKTLLWEGVHAQTGITARLLVLPMQPGTNVGAVLQDSLGFNEGPLQRLALKGPNIPAYAEAYTAPLKAAQGKPGRVVAVSLPEGKALAVVVLRFRTADQQQTEEGAIIESLQHSRFYSETEARALKPLEIATFRAASTDSAARRAALMPQGALRDAWFRALNGLGHTEDLKPGVWYKTVIDPNQI